MNSNKNTHCQIRQTICLLLFITLFFFSCKNTEKENPYTLMKIPELNQQDLAEGFQLLQNNCFSCHNPNATEETKAGPTMAAIKNQYMKSHPSQEEFVRDYLIFLNNPSEENSKMPEAITRFNLMPKMSLNDEQILKVAMYLYSSEIENPNWFEKQYDIEKQKYQSNTSISPIETGQEIALKTKGVLGKNLLEALNAKGTENALSFCSTRAIPLTDSMAIALHARIKRVSDKNRNPENKANEAELAYIESTKMAIARGDKPKPQLTTLDEVQIGYYPIMTNKMCLQCHGQVEADISSSTLSKINSLYPDDLATGYSSDELRGIWVVEMDKK